MKHCRYLFTKYGGGGQQPLGIAAISLSCGGNVAISGKRLWPYQLNNIVSQRRSGVWRINKARVIAS